jgi:uncharacterized protein (TIGR03437 family)
MSRQLGFSAMLLCIANHSRAQVTQPTILEIDVHNIVSYSSDVFDASKFAADASRTSAAAVRNFGFVIAVGDIMFVNGSSAKGTLVVQQRLLTLTPTPGAGQAVADIARTAVSNYLFEIQQSDGTPVGSIFTIGLSGGTSPAGAPTGGNNLAIAGGTGAYFGLRGQMIARGFPDTAPFRTASVTEDPERRRTLAAGERVRFVAQLLPLTKPEVGTAASGPAIFHQDFSPVTPGRPARRGEVLIARASGLGPTPSIAVGQPFPLQPLEVVNSPVAVTVGGREAEVLNKIGWPGLVDTYRIDFRVPQDVTQGLIGVQLSAAWVSGPEVKVAVE